MRFSIALLVLGCLYSNFAEEFNEDTITDFLAGHAETNVFRRSVPSSASTCLSSLAKSFASEIGQAAQIGAKMSSGINSAFTSSCLNGRPVVPRPPTKFNNRDYVFVLDTSGSINDDDFRRAKEDVEMFFEIFCPTSFGNSVTAEGNKQVALVFFDDTATTEVSFEDSHKGLGYLKNKIRSLQRRRGYTATANALQYVKNNILGRGSSRINVPNVSTDVIVLTDGKCNRQCSSLARDADSLRESGANVISIGIGNSRDCELDIISGKRDGHSYHFGDSTALDKFSIAVSEVAKNQPKRCV